MKKVNGNRTMPPSKKSGNPSVSSHVAKGNGRGTHRNNDNDAQHYSDDESSDSKVLSQNPLDFGLNSKVLSQNPLDFGLNSDSDPSKRYTSRNLTLGNADNHVQPTKMQEKIDVHHFTGILNSISIYDDIKYVGKGAFSKVFKATVNDDLEAAFKIEESDNKKSKKVQSYPMTNEALENKTHLTHIDNEYKLYRHLHRNKLTSIPAVYDFHTKGTTKILVMELLGNNLGDLFKLYKQQFKMQTIMQIAIDSINIIESIHNTGIIHRDIKPDNFIMGKQDDQKLYLCDLGLGTFFIRHDASHNKYVHMSYKNGFKLIGTPRYASVNVHFGHAASRRDDVISITYMLIYFALKRLPWQGIQQNTDKINDAIYKLKMTIDPEALCKDIPNCFYQCLIYCTKLTFTQEPDYKHMKKLFINTCNNLNIMPCYEWSES